LAHRQGKNLLENLTPITDFRLKRCIKDQKSKNKTSGETVEKVPEQILGEMQKKMTSQNAPQSTI
jgi:hypothetical protein